MCGILGVINYGTTTHQKALACRKAVKRLLEESQMRGTDAAGLLILYNNCIHMFKNNVSARTLMLDSRYNDLMDNIKVVNNFRYAIGHTRCKTKGDQKYNINNHPIKTGDVIGVHNGTIYNDDTLFEEYSENVKRQGQVDSEIIFSLLDYFLKEKLSIIEAVCNTHSLLNGGYACAFMTTKNPRYVTLFRDSMSAGIEIFMSKKTQIIVFASTKYIVKNSLSDIKDIGSDILENPIELKKNGIRIDTFTGKMCQFDTNSLLKKAS